MYSTYRPVSVTTWFCTLLLLGIGIATPCLAGETTEKEDPFQLLLKEFEKEQADWSERYDSKLSEQEKIDHHESWPGWPFIARVEKLTEEELDQPYALDALLWIVNRSFQTSLIDKRLFVADNSVIARLGRRFPEEPRIVECFEAMARYPSPAREQFLRDRLKLAKNHELRGYACLALAELLRNKRTLSSNYQQWSGQKKKESFDQHTFDRFAPEYLEYIRSIDTVEAIAESRKFLKLVIQEYGEIDFLREISYFSGKPKLAVVAALLQAKIAPVAIGKPAPSIQGKDLDGKPLKLSDYHGKVTVLVFWTSTCGPCIAKFPYLEKLAARLEAAPFAIVGVNCNREIDVAIKFCKNRKVPWPSLYWKMPGGSMGSWVVDGSPMLTTYVLDHHGVVRYRDVKDEQLDNAVDTLLQELADKVEVKQ